MQLTSLVSSTPQLWGGIEPTHVRIEDHWVDQIALVGHDKRIDDLDLVAQIGFKAMRYPALWSNSRRTPDGGYDFSEIALRLERLRGLGIAPIVGLLHHGCGPDGIDLISPEFAPRFAEYARQFAERFPWIENYNLINEPVTTARFSCLYGYWYPHLLDSKAFVEVVINQCLAIKMATEEIKRINPSARMIHTDDFGKSFATERLQYQADFENARRWLAVDLLHGLVDEWHPLWEFIASCGVDTRLLAPFRIQPSPPDVIGIDYYVTSERFLDEDIQRYPPFTWGGNGVDEYSDIEVVRVCAEGLEGPEALATEAWQRYGLPVAFTEVHIGSPVDDQIRWFSEFWETAKKVRAKGIPIEGVTAWALLGSYDWDSLLTRSAGSYEPGAFDCSQGAPIPTPLSNVLKQCAEMGKIDQPCAGSPGWWRSRDRLLYPPRSRAMARRDLFDHERGRLLA